MRIAFLLDNAYGIGGTIRSTINLSKALADRHTVEVISLRQSRDRTALPFDPRVTLRSLLDLRRDSPAYDGGDPLFHRPSERFTEGRDHFERGIATRLGDLRMAAYLRDTDADVVIATRPKLNDYLAAYGSTRYLRIGQEHLTHQMHNEHVRTHQDAAIPQLDALVTVSYTDAADYRASLPEAALTHTVICCVPNSVPATDVTPSDGRSKLIVAAGRLIRVKRYDRLLRAFALVAERHPDWRLRLYGRGRLRPQLRELVDRLGLYDRAYLMGAHAPIETEWAKGAIAAVSSNAESFGMTLVEAMHCGVPIVSTDCPHGPREIITNGREGLLTPLGKETQTVRTFADALTQLIENPGLRHRMSQAALHRGARYAPERIAAEYEELIAKLSVRRPPQPASLDSGPEMGVGTRSGSGPGAGTESEAGVGPESVPGAGRGPEPGGVPERSRDGGALPGTRWRRGVPYGVRVLAVRVVRLLRGARRWLRERGHGDDPALPRPRARVRVVEDGAIAVRLRAGRLPDGASDLLLRARRADTVAPVRIPLPPREDAVDGWVEVRLDHGTHQLAEGRWDAYVVEQHGRRRRKRVRAELVETARLLSLPTPLDGTGAVAPWVPYATADGYLAVRAWYRPAHAEVTSVELGQHAFTVRAELYGAAGQGEGVGGTEVAVVAVPRVRARRGFQVPGRRSGRSVSFELPYELPGAFGAGEVWDLWLRTGGQRDDRVRLARLLGDLVDRRKTDVAPPVRLGPSGAGLQLRFTHGNNLTLERTQLPATAPDDPAALTAGPGSPLVRPRT